MRIPGYSQLRDIGEHWGVVGPDQAKLDRQVKDTATRLFVEMGGALALNAAIMTWVATPVSFVLISSALGATLTWLAAEVGGYVAVRCLKGRTSMQLSAPLTQFSHWLSVLSVVNWIGSAGPVIAIHETGHMVAGYALYNSPTILIDRLTPFKGGNTSIQHYKVHDPLKGISSKITKEKINPFTFLGTLLGGTNVKIAVAAGGIIATTVIALCALFHAFDVEKEHPKIARLLEIGAITQSLSDIGYGLHEWRSPSGTGDFEKLLQLTGLPPLAFVAALVVIPAAFYYLLKQMRARYGT